MTGLILAIYAVFVTLVFGIYKLVKKEKRYIVLLIFSLIALAVYSKFLSFFVLATIITVYFAGFGINKLNLKQQEALSKEGLLKEDKKAIKSKFKKNKNWIVVGATVFNLAILAILKYSGFFVSIFEGFFSWFNVTMHIPFLKIGMPIGISYYTLTSIGYMVDVGRGKYPYEKNPFKIALFICYFPSMYEGPFNRYDNFEPQISAGGNTENTNVGYGYIHLLFGLFKKIVVADRFAIVANEIFKNYTSFNGGMVALGVICFTIQLYAEFSGFIDMAEGVSEIFGIKLKKNFDQPFFSQTVGEFWRRWHITLGEWFKDYIFYPISMSKPMLKLNKKLHGKVNEFFELFIPSLIALFVVWFTTGLWHGASWLYVVYGLYYYLLMIIGMLLEPLTNKIYTKCKINKDNVVLKILKILRTFILVNLGMLIFRSTSLGSAFEMIGQLFASTASSQSLVNIIPIKDIVVAMIGLCAIIAIDSINEFGFNIREKICKSRYAIKYTICLVLIFAVLIFGAWGVGYTVIDAIYGGF